MPQKHLLLLVTAVGRVQHFLLLTNEETTHMSSKKRLSISLFDQSLVQPFTAVPIRLLLYCMIIYSVYIYRFSVIDDITLYLSTRGDTFCT